MHFEIWFHFLHIFAGLILDKRQFPIYHIVMPQLDLSLLHWQKRPVSPTQQNENPGTKPPLPINLSQFRKGAYNGSLDFVLSLCETSFGLVDVFPIEDRKHALHEVNFFTIFLGCFVYLIDTEMEVCIYLYTF